MSHGIGGATTDDGPTLPMPVTAGRHAFVVDLEGLDAIAQSQVNLAVWPREPDPEFASWLDAVCAAITLDTSQRVLRGRPDASALVGPLPPGRWRDVLQRDIESLAAAYASWVDLPSACAQLVTIDTDKCRRYHSDFVGLRLLCTYSGRGTEWVEEHAVERISAGVVVLDRNALRSLGRFDVGVLKGNRWPGNDDRGCIHRSPPIARYGERRLLLRVDAS